MFGNQELNALAEESIVRKREIGPAVTWSCADDDQTDD